LAHRPVRELLRFAVRRRRAALPTIARIGPFRFFFYSNEGTEPPHVHVQHESTVAKFWLNPVALAASGGFSAPELRTVEGLVTEEEQHFLEAWNEFFRGRSHRPGDGR
jgi:hypothetical protein